jgi:hypothetical protein
MEWDKLLENIGETDHLKTVLEKGPIPIPREGHSEWLPEQVAAVICNPIYAGVPPYPPLVEQEVWIRAFSKIVERHGLELALKIMLDDLRQDYK